MGGVWLVCDGLRFAYPSYGFRFWHVTGWFVTFWQLCNGTVGWGVRMESLCDGCRRPGSCCVGFTLAQGVLHDGPAGEVDAVLAAIVTATARDGSGSAIAGYGDGDFAVACSNGGLAHVALGLPFRRMMRDASGRWLYWCPRLGADGRCRAYDTRPAPCRALEPGTAKPCCHYVPGIGACMDRPLPQ